MIPYAADELMKQAADVNWFRRHRDASSYRQPAPARGPLAGVSPYGRYHAYRQLLTRTSTKQLLADLGKQKATAAATPETRAMVDEARARGLQPPAWGKSPEAPTPPPTVHAPMTAAVLGSLVTGALAERGVAGKAPLFRSDAVASPNQIAAKALVDELQRVGVAVNVNDHLPEHFNPETKAISVRTKSHLSTLAHEAGHATPDALSGALHKLYGPGKIYGLVAMPIVTMGTYVGMGDTSFQPTPADKRRRIENAQKVIALESLPYAPVLAEEARASIKGVRMVNRLRGGGEAARAALRLVPAFGTYAATGAAPAVALALLQRKKNKLGHPAQEIQKAASAWTPARIQALADSLGVAWDDDPRFLAFSEAVVGKKRLDAMSQAELATLAGALVRKRTTSEKIAAAAFREELEKIGNWGLSLLRKAPSWVQRAATSAAPTIERAGLTASGNPLAVQGILAGAGIKALGGGLSTAGKYSARFGASAGVRRGHTLRAMGDLAKTWDKVGDAVEPLAPLAGMIG